MKYIIIHMKGNQRPEAWGSLTALCEAHDLPYHSIKGKGFPIHYGDSIIEKVKYNSISKVNLFRLDDYQDQNGDLVGFFVSYEQAKTWMDQRAKPESNQPSFPFYQITEFRTALPVKFSKATNRHEIDNALIHWEKGEILHNYYFKIQ